MRLLASIVILISLPFIMSYFAPEVEADQEYCNERYDFCINYPEAVFTQIFFPENGDGILLQSADGRYSLRVSGSHNILNWTAVKILDQSILSISDEDGPVDKLMIETGAEPATALYRSPKSLYYEEVWSLPTGILTLTLKGPLGKEEDIRTYRSMVSVQIPVQ